jgi:hypothetical protein
MCKHLQHDSLLEKYRFFFATKILLKFAQIQTSVQEKSHKLQKLENNNRKHFTIKPNINQILELSPTGQKTYEGIVPLSSFKKTESSTV